MAGYVTVSNDAIAVAGRDTEMLGAVLALYLKADRLKWAPFRAATSYLALELGITEWQVRQLLDGLVAQGCLDVIERGDKHTPRLIRLHKPTGTDAGVSRPTETDATHGATLNPTHKTAHHDHERTPKKRNGHSLPHSQAHPQSLLIDPTPTSTSTSPLRGDLDLVFDRWIVLWRVFNPGTTKRKWTTREAGTIRARLGSGEYKVEDLLAMIAWAKDGADDYAKCLRGDPCRYTKNVRVEPHVGADTLFKPHKFEDRVMHGRRYVTSIGGMEVLASIEELDRISQAEEADGEPTGGDSGAARAPEAGARGSAERVGDEGGNGSVDGGDAGVAGRASRTGHLRLVEADLALAGGALGSG